MVRSEGDMLGHLLRREGDYRIRWQEKIHQRKSQRSQIKVDLGEYNRRESMQGAHQKGEQPEEKDKVNQG